MIENATVTIGERDIPTRLHEHGLQPTTHEYQPRSEWLESGYFDGKPEDMQAIKDASPPILEVKVGGVVDTILTGVQWGEVNVTYPGHAILHLDWAPDGRER